MLEIIFGNAVSRWLLKQMTRGPIRQVLLTLPFLVVVASVALFLWLAFYASKLWKTLRGGR